LSCSATGNPTPNVTWTRSGGADVLGTGETLTISDVKISDGGCYVCTAYNNIGSEANPASVHVTSTTPSGDTFASNITVIEGESLTLNCTATGCPTPNITWTKHGVSAALRSNITTEIIHQIASVQKSHAGRYTCAANNEIGTVSRTLSVTVHSAPSITFITANMTVTEGSLVNLQCNTSGSLPLNVSWSKVGAAGALSSSGSHELSSITRAQEGTYECMVRN
ncbi:predicted protein, partial [Nematostella vectensis]